MTHITFYDYYGNIYTHTDGMAMGSPLDLTLSNFYMTHVENKVFNNSPNPQYMPDTLMTFSYY